MRGVSAPVKRAPAGKARESVLLFPAVAMLAGFFVLPILLTVYYSFTNLALTGENAKNLQYVGIQNYTELLEDPSLYISIFNTIIFLIGSLVGQQILGFVLAAFMKNKNKTFRRFVGSCILAGWVMPEIVAALCFSAFFGDSGTINIILKFLHLQTVEWLYQFPMLTVILANIWHGTAFSMMNFQSALDSVPGEIVDAAKVDGAGRLQNLIWIVLPSIKNNIATNTLLNTLSTLGVFGLVYTMTGGGPGTKTLTLPVFMYKEAFVSYQLGYGTAISMILLVIGILFSVIYIRLTGE